MLVFGVSADFKGRSFFSVDNPAVILETVKMVRTKSNEATMSHCKINNNTLSTTQFMRIKQIISAFSFWTFPAANA